MLNWNIDKNIDTIIITLNRSAFHNIANKNADTFTMSNEDTDIISIVLSVFFLNLNIYAISIISAEKAPMPININSFRVQFPHLKLNIDHTVIEVNHTNMFQAEFFLFIFSSALPN